MQSVKRPGRPARSRQPVLEPEPEGVEPGEDELDLEDIFDMHRVTCPECAQPIALLPEEDTLPEHALCPTPWNPFGLQVCPGTGLTASTTRPAGEQDGAHDQDSAVLLTLPQGLDWRTQPFSHVGGPGTRPVRQRAAA
ncbi:hypothetical protein HUT18_02675 [Streptomyces sp. NA04227]|uniref:hypothetical protein n=1 Tax=Streptomyces sp. NA04227 TaxID=2742136 RepID=UPI00158FC723|nr:hypothetical protein [Streptomyces sp. NA04227]QKW05442.1 hypothetical protein HUT18_02675 [Streptomyces sp. NA04227]